MCSCRDASLPMPRALRQASSTVAQTLFISRFLCCPLSGSYAMFVLSVLCFLYSLRICRHMISPHGQAVRPKRDRVLSLLFVFFNLCAFCCIFQFSFIFSSFFSLLLFALVLHVCHLFSSLFSLPVSSLSHHRLLSPHRPPSRCLPRSCMTGDVPARVGASGAARWLRGT